MRSTTLLDTSRCTRARPHPAFQTTVAVEPLSGDGKGQKRLISLLGRSWNPLEPSENRFHEHTLKPTKIQLKTTANHSLGLKTNVPPATVHPKTGDVVLSFARRERWRDGFFYGWLVGFCGFGYFSCEVFDVFYICFCVCFLRFWHLWWPFSWYFWILSSSLFDCFWGFCFFLYFFFGFSAFLGWFYE